MEVILKLGVINGAYPQNGNFDEVSCLWAKRKMDMGTGIPHAEGLSLGEI